MRQAPPKPVENRKTVPSPFIFFLLAAALLASGLTLFFPTPKPEPALPTVNEVVAQKVAAVTENNKYGLTIEESGPGYTIRFAGQVFDEKIYGRIDAYDLEVFSAREKHFVKGASLFDDWKEAGLAELDALASLVRNPVELLEILMSEKEILIEEGPDRLVEDVKCRTYFLELPPPDIRLLTRFDDKDATLDKLQLYLWFSEEGVFLHRMAMLMNITVEGEKIQINRIYSLTPDSKELPDGLPKVQEGILAI